MLIKPQLVGVMRIMVMKVIGVLSLETIITLLPMGQLIQMFIVFHKIWDMQFKDYESERFNGFLTLQYAPNDKITATLDILKATYEIEAAKK